MANEVGYIEANATFHQHVFRDATDFTNVEAANDLRVATHNTEHQLDLTSLDGTTPLTARASIKIDLGSVWAPEYFVRACFEIAATPTAGGTIDAYWGPSHTGTAANGNPAGLTGSDANYSGYSSNLDDSLAQLIHIGSFVTTAQASTTEQKGHFGTFAPPTRYGILVVYNNSGADFVANANNHHIVFDPLIPQMQV